MYIFTKKVISLRDIIFYVLFLSCITHLSAQYTTSDYSPTNSLSEGLTAPGRMAIDDNNNIYVTDAIQKSIIKYNSQGNFISTINSGLNPLSIALNIKNQLFVGDQNTGDIYIIHSDGTKTKFYTGLTFPASMIFGSNNILYVVDSKQKRVIGLDVAGNIIKDFTFSTFTFPTGIAFDHQNNHIIVSEHGGIGEDMECGGGCSLCWSTMGPQTSIYIFDLDGNHLISFGCFGTDDGLFQRIQGITVGACGNIYATDPYLGRVSIFDSDGNYITKFGQQGDGSGELNLPMDIEFSSDNRVFVSSMNKGEIDVFTITESLPTATIISSDKTICIGTSTEIIVNFTGTAPWTFNYTLNGLNPTEITTSESSYTILTSEEGLYEISTLSDAIATGTCFTGSAYIQVLNSLPTATVVTTNLTKCSTDDTGIEIQFTGIAPWTFTYTIDGLNPIDITTTKNPYIIEVVQSGLYEITEVADDGCVGESIIGNATVIVYPLPTANITNGNDRINIYSGTYASLNIEFTGTAPWTFIYTRDDINPISITTSENPYMLSVSEEGTYEVKEIMDDFCYSTISEGFPEVVIQPIKATIETTTIYVCEGDTSMIPVYFTGTAPWIFSYRIDGIDAGSITTSTTPYQLESSFPGVYELSSFADANNPIGDFSGIAQITENPLPVVDLGEDIVLNVGESVMLDAGEFNAYLWSNGETTQTITISNEGTYSVEVTDVNGCSSSGSINVTIDTLSVDDFKDNKKGDLTIYPNPSHGEFTLKITSVESISTNISVLIKSTSGQTIFSEVFNPNYVTIYEGSIYIYINIENFTKGIYIVYVNAENFSEQGKLILKD